MAFSILWVLGKQFLCISFAFYTRALKFLKILGSFRICTLTLLPGAPLEINIFFPKDFLCDILFLNLRIFFWKIGCFIDCVKPAAQKFMWLDIQLFFQTWDLSFIIKLFPLIFFFMIFFKKSRLFLEFLQITDSVW